MSKLMSLKLDVSKITKDKIFKGEKGAYIDVTISLNDEPDQYGNHLSAWEGQSKEEREAKTPKNYLGNGKVFWEGESKKKAEAKPANYDPDDLPF